jgi:hypothetical protein
MVAVSVFHAVVHFAVCDTAGEKNMEYSLAESWESVTAARLWEVSRWAGQTRERVYGCGWLCQPCFGLL